MTNKQTEPIRTADEIEALLCEIATQENCDEGDPHFGMTYYQGIKAALEWMLGEADTSEIL